MINSSLFTKFSVIKLSLSVALLAAIIMGYYMVNSIVNEPVNVPVSILGFSASRSETRRLEPINQYEAISGVPLFDEDREPEKIIVKKKIMQKIPVKQKLSVQALGIAVTGENILAVLKDLKNGKIIRLRINEEIYGWTLKGVSADSFVFSKGETEKTIKFKSNGD